MASDVRSERDSLGEVKVPAAAYYGAQTQRAVENFPVSGLRADRDFIKSYARLKKAAASVNAELGAVPAELADVISQAAQEVIEGKHDDQFVVDVFQAGAGTSFHMNVNEVIANRALEILGKPRADYAALSPNDHVNYGQSTNDTFPTVIHLAALEKWTHLMPVLEKLADALAERGKAFDGVVKAARTHLQDAVPIRLGQEFAAYSEAIHRTIRLGQAAADELGDLAIGGSAAGTGLNVKPGYREAIVKALRDETGLPLRSAYDLREAMQSRQAVGAMSGVLRSLALELTRIANDFRLLSSGPATGLGEMTLPAVQPGSSIMPAKVNPVMAECLNMVSFQVIGNDTAVSYAVQAGQLELNVMMPLMAHNLLQSFAILNNFLPVFTDKCVVGIEADVEVCERYALKTAALGTVLNPVTGYLKAAELIKKSLKTGKTIKEVVREEGVLSEDEVERLFDVRKLTEEP